MRPGNSSAGQRQAEEAHLLLSELDLNTPAPAQCWGLVPVAEPRAALSACSWHGWERAGAAGYKMESEFDSHNLIRYHGPDALGLPESLSVHQILEYLRRAVWGTCQMGLGLSALPCLGRRVS